jgi:hypothetical protein
MAADPKSILSGYEAAKSERAMFEGLWDDVARYIRPEVQFQGKRTPGEDVRTPVYDDTATLAANELAAALDGLLTNSSMQWFAFAPADPTVEMNDELERELASATRQVLAWFDNPASGFSTALPEVYRDLVCFGTGCLLRHWDKGIPVRYQARCLSSIYLEEDDDGTVTGVYRLFEMRAEELMRTFPDATLPDSIQKAAESTRADAARRKWEVVHSVRRRWGADPTQHGNLNMPWESCYVLVDGKVLLRESGYRKNPYLTPRIGKLSGEVYGRSPGMDALPSIRSINATGKQTLQAGDLMIRPPMNVPANGLEGKLNMSPGAVNYYRMGSRDFAGPMITGVNPDFGAKELERRAKGIERHFYSDRLRLPEQDRMTAAEIYARQAQGLVTFSPMLGRLYSELLHEVVIDAYEKVVLNGQQDSKRKPLPKLAVSYTSPLAGSRDAAQGQAFDATMASLVPLAQVDPRVMDVIDTDTAPRLLARSRMLNPKFLRSQKDVKAMRAQQAQMAQVSQAAALAEQGSVAVKNMAAAGKGVAGGV